MDVIHEVKASQMASIAQWFSRGDDLQALKKASASIKKGRGAAIAPFESDVITLGTSSILFLFFKGRA